MIAVPALDRIDVHWGNVKHLPKWEDIPDRFRNDREPCCRLVEKWFFDGLSADEGERLTARDGVTRGPALGAIRAILTSFEPSQEHKIAGAAYLLSEWFELAPAKGATP